MVLVEKWPFFQFFFFCNLFQENVFNHMLERKNAFLGYKNKKFKKSKNWHFSQGVNPWFCPKVAIFPPFFFWQLRQGKCLLRYARRKKRLSTLLKQEVQKVVKLTFSQGVNPWFWWKNDHFSNFFFLSNLFQENVFNHMLQRKNAFFRL